MNLAAARNLLLAALKRRAAKAPLNLLAIPLAQLHAMPPPPNLLRLIGVRCAPVPVVHAPPLGKPKSATTAIHAPAERVGVIACGPAGCRTYEAPLLAPALPPFVPPPRPAAPLAQNLGREWRIAVVGSPVFNNFARMAEHLDPVIERTRANRGQPILLSQGHTAFDALVRQYARVRGIRCIDFTPDFRTHARQALTFRNGKMAESAHEVVAFWDGASRETPIFLDLAKRRQLPVERIDLSQASGGVRLPSTPEARQGPTDLTRILDLPRSDQAPTIDHDAMTLELKRPGVAVEMLEPGPLLPIQARALAEAKASLGGVLAMGVGSGKTLTSFLLPVVLEAKVAVLFVKPSLYKKALREYARLRLSWSLVPLGDFTRPMQLGAEGGLLDFGGARQVLYIISLGQLSTQANSDMLDRLQPDLILVDEAHELRGADSARSRRVKRFFDRFPNTRAVFLSGTISNSKLTDYWHLCRWALGAGSPLPLSSHTAEAFDAAFGVKTDAERYAEAAARGKDAPELGYVRDIRARFGRWAEAALGAPLGPEDDAFRLRLTTTPGFVATNSASDDGNELTIVEQSVVIPAAIRLAVKKLEDEWVTPAGVEIASQLEYEAAMRTLNVGFFNRWVWPNGPDREWLEARRNWSRAVRQFLKLNLEKLDSPFLVDKACARKDDRVSRFNVALDGEQLVPMLRVYDAWGLVRHRPEPETEAVWIDTFIIDDVVALAQTKQFRGDDAPIIWYESPAVGDALEQLLKCPRFGAGPSDSRRLEELAERVLERKQAPVPIICSILCHGTGKNLQGWGKSIVAQCPSNGSAFEQLLGRLHRKRQRADEVVFHLYTHSSWAKDALAKAKSECEYQQRTIGSPQKLCLAEFVDASDLL